LEQACTLPSASISSAVTSPVSPAPASDAAVAASAPWIWTPATFLALIVPARIAPDGAGAGEGGAGAARRGAGPVPAASIAARTPRATSR
jgi:hypothetical protein